MTMPIPPEVRFEDLLDFLEETCEGEDAKKSLMMQRAASSAKLNNQKGVGVDANGAVTTEIQQ